MKYLFTMTLTASLFFKSCASSKEAPRENLDIDKLNTEMSDPKNSRDANLKIVKEEKPNWKKLFEGQPTAKERPRLQARILELELTDKPEEILKKGRIHFSLGQYALAEASFRSVLRKSPQDLEALTELANVLIKARKMDQAFHILSEAKNQIEKLERPSSNQILQYRYTLAMAYLSNQEKAKAHQILTDLIGKDGSFVPGYSMLAVSYLKEGKDSVAKFIVEQGMDRGGDHPAFFNILGLLAEKQGQTSKARDYYNRALGLNDSFAPALVNRANLNFANQETRMAETDYKKALDGDPANVDAMIGLGATLRKTGRYKSAKETFEQALELDPENPLARFNLAVTMHENLKEPGSALRYFNEVLQSDRANPQMKSTAKSMIDEIHSI